jgi:uncharacterized protein (TIGR02453 family)
MEKIQKSTLEFLKDLNHNNNRDWFINNRVRYDSARLNFELLVQAVIDQIALLDPIFKGLSVKNCTYRINRDIRFSKDKSIYKTHFGAFIVRGGKKNGDHLAGYYLHLEPGKSIIAGGAYMPPTPWLNKIREKINEKPESLLDILDNKTFKHYFSKLGDDKLKTAPKGYLRDNPAIELLKYKSYLAVNEVTDKIVLSDAYFDHIIKVVSAMKPLNDYLNDY